MTAQRAYDQVVEAKMLPRFRLIILFGMLIFVGFNYLDVLVYPELAAEFLRVRLAGGAIMVATCLWSLANRERRPDVVWLLDVTILPIIAAIAWMIYRSEGIDSPYDEGLNVVLLAMVVVNSFRPAHNGVVGLASIGMYLAAVLLNERPITVAPLASSLFFSGATIFFVAMMARLYGKQHKDLYDEHRRLQETEELKDQFFANVSHELRTPLALIIGPLRRYLQQADANANASTVTELKVAERNAVTLLHQVNQLLDLSKLDAGRMEVRYVETDLGACVRFVASHFEARAQERGLNLAVDVPPALKAPVDRQKFERIVFNLLSNACKFVGEGGWIRCTLTSTGERVRLTVEDNGPGVPPAMRQAIFERFRQVDGGVTRRFEGTGLGLAIVAEFVGVLGGEVVVESGEAGGALFSVTLPLRVPAGCQVLVEDEAPVAGALELADEARAEQMAVTSEAEAAEPGTAEPGGAPDESRPRVLVVEDHFEMNRFIRRALSPHALTEGAADGAAGLAAMRRRRPDLVVTDIMMPGMSGAEMIAAMRQDPDLQHLPVIVLTAKADDELKDRLLGDGAQDYLCKPFTAEELVARARNLIEMKRVRDALAGELTRSQTDLAGAVQSLGASKRATEQALRDAEAAARAKDEFLMNLSHELRTPLTSILGWSDYIVNFGGLPRDVGEAMAVLHRNAEALQKLVEDLLDLSRIVQGKLRLELRPTLLARLIHTAVAASAPAAHGKGLTLVEDVDAELGMAMVDGDRLQQVLWCLLSNAVKFTPTGGQVTILARRQAMGDLVIEVRDTGQGISPEFLPHVFERLSQEDASTTRRFGGLGVGLAIARTLVEMHGGRLEVLSPGVGKGATFRLALPVARLQGEVRRESRAIGLH